MVRNLFTSRYIGLWVVFIIGLVLRLVGINDRPFDGDEGVIAQIADGSIGQVLAAVGNDVHPPLYHLFVSGSISLFGLSEWSVRLVGVVAGLALVLLGPLLAKRYQVPVLPATLLLAVSPFLVNLAQDARMYSLFVFLAAASWLLTLSVAADGYRRSKLIGLLLVNLALVLTHHLGWLILTVEGLIVLLFYRSTIREHWRAYLGAGIALLIGYSWQLPMTLAQVQGRLLEQSASASLAETVKGVVGALYRFGAGRTFLDVTPNHILDLVRQAPFEAVGFVLTLLVPILLLLSNLRRSAQHPDRRIRLASLVALGAFLLVALLVGSVGIQAVRYLSFLAPFVLLLMVRGAREIIQFWWGKLTISLFVGITIAGLFTQYQVHNQAAGLDTHAQYLQEHGISGDTVIVRGAFAGGESWGLEYYLGPHAFRVIDVFGEYRAGNLAELRAVSSVQHIETVLIEVPRVWFFDQTYQSDPLAELNPEYHLDTIELGMDKEGQPLRLFLVERPSER